MYNEGNHCRHNEGVNGILNTKTHVEMYLEISVQASP